MSDNQSENFFQNIEKNIRQLAKSSGMTLAQLAQAIDMTEAGFYKMLSTESMKVKTLIKLSDVLKRPVTAFFSPGTKIYNIDETLNQVAEPSGEYHSEKESLKKQIRLLESQIQDKNKIIELLSTRK